MCACGQISFSKILVLERAHALRFKIHRKPLHELDVSDLPFGGTGVRLFESIHFESNILSQMNELLYFFYLGSAICTPNYGQALEM